MAFDAKVIRVLIASPNDVPDARMVIPEVIHTWNANNSSFTNVVLLPVKWETHATPSLYQTAQNEFNDQIVYDCDLLIGAFLSRIGTKTGTHVSGTAEEIDIFISKNKPVMLYFSKQPVSLEHIDLDQLEKLRNYESKMKSTGLIDSYNTIDDFRNKLSSHIHTHTRNIIASLSNSTISNSKKSDATIKPPVVSIPQKNNQDGIEWLSENKIDEFILTAIDNTCSESGWSNTASVGNYLSNYSPVNYKEKGFKTLKQFLLSKEYLLEIKMSKLSDNAQNADTAYVRRKISE